MTIKTTLIEYKDLGEYFSPDYERENDVLSQFKKVHPVLSKAQVLELRDILIKEGNREDKIFVADLMYLYPRMDDLLFDPMIDNAIEYPDVSFNRIFVRPCVTCFGIKKVAAKLQEKFVKEDILKKIKISTLVYWLRPKEGENIAELHNTIIERAKVTDNLVELYFYKLRYAGKVPSSLHIPNSAEELIKAVSGNQALETLLFEKLNWRRNNGS